MLAICVCLMHSRERSNFTRLIIYQQMPFLDYYSTEGRVQMAQVLAECTEEAKKNLNVLFLG